MHPFIMEQSVVRPRNVAGVRGHGGRFGSIAVSRCRSPCVKPFLSPSFKLKKVGSQLRAQGLRARSRVTASSGGDEGAPSAQPADRAEVLEDAPTAEAGDLQPSAAVSNTISALDLVLGTEEKEAAAAEAAAAVKAAEEAARPVDKTAEFRAARDQLRVQDTIRSLLAMRPLPPSLMEWIPSSRTSDEVLEWVPDDKMLNTEQSKQGGETSDEGAAEGAREGAGEGAAEGAGSAESGGAPQAGAFQLPLVNVTAPLPPGEMLTLNLFEPRWVTLFSKLLADEPSKARELCNARGAVALNLDREASMLVYEMPVSGSAAAAAEQQLQMPVVPGHGRLDEAAFVGSRRFGVCYREGGRMARVGTVVHIVATDVVRTNSGIPVLVVIGRAAERFKVERVMQEQPYTIVEAAQWEGAEGAQPPSSSPPASGEPADQVREAVAAALLDGVETGAARAEERGLGERWAEVSQEGALSAFAGGLDKIRQELQSLEALTLASLVLRRQPRTVQSLLQRSDGQETDAAILRVVKTALEYKGSWSSKAFNALSYAPIVLFIYFISRGFFEDSF